jgi:hypothetical protein
MKTKNNYSAPEISSILLEVEQCFLTSSDEASENGYTMNDFIDGGEL